MHVQFEYTQEDLFDASRRFLDRSKIANVGMWQSALYFALFAGVVLFFIFINNPPERLAFGSVAAIISVLLYPSLHKSGVKKRLRKLVQKEMANPRSLYL